LLLLYTGTTFAAQPHLFLIIVDDLGWSDISAHGSDFPTPVIDSLISGGVDLHKYYVQPVCSPTRSAIVSGRFPHKLGMQHFTTIPPGTTAHFPQDVPMMAELLRDEGYATHAIGKWHLGYSKWDYTPTGRGFDTYTGYFQGAIDYYTKDVGLNLVLKGANGINGGDFWQNRTFFNTSNASYSMNYYQERALQILDGYNASAPDAKPLFLYFAHQNIHEPLQLPNPDRGAAGACARVNATTRRNTLCQMMYAVDSAIGEFVDKVKARGLWDDSLFWFTTDNGGMIAYDDGGGASASSNQPFRAGKTTLFEGGVRGVSFVTGGKNVFPDNARGTKTTQLMHAVDLLPSILPLVSKPGARAWEGRRSFQFDGMDMWGAITGTPVPNLRKELPLNINPRCSTCKLSGILGGHQPTKWFPILVNYSAIIQGDWKLILGSAATLYDGWWASSQGGAQYNMSNASRSDTDAPVHLYNISDDESERNNLAAQHPDVVAQLVARIEHYADTANGFVQPQNIIPHLSAFPHRHGGVWAPFES